MSINDTKDFEITSTFDKNLVLWLDVLKFKCF